MVKTVRVLMPLFLCAFAGGAFAQQTSDWMNLLPPYPIIANIYYGGSQGLASYLITTPEGNILINANLEKSVPMIRESVEKLGFHFSDTKILLISHAHWDHCAGSASVKERTGAKYMVMDADVPEIEAGGKGNFQSGEPLSTHQGGPRTPRRRRSAARRHSARRAPDSWAHERHDDVDNEGNRR